MEETHGPGRATGVMPGEQRLRDHLREIIRGALDSVSPEALLAGFLGQDGSLGGVPPELGTPWAERLSEGPPLRVVAFGKAAPRMTRGFLSALPSGREATGIVLAPAPFPSDPELPPTFRLFAGGHPLPTEEGAAATAEIVRFLGDGGADDPVVVLISGGGSALLVLPQPGITIDDLGTTTELLLRAGASITEVNTVRKHLEVAKGGGLAGAAFPAPVLGLVISDVVGDSLDVIASGPLSPDPTTFRDALAVLERHDLLHRAPSSVWRRLREGADGLHLETPEAGSRVFERVRTRLVGNLAVAAEGAAAAARHLGYRTHVTSLTLTGEARTVGDRLGALARSLCDARNPGDPPRCLISGGETTVTVTGNGSGGRNQETVLGAAERIEALEGVLVASFGTDGIDGPTDAAGGLVTGSTLARSRAAGLDLARALVQNDSYPFLSALGDLTITGPTGTNVMDLQVILVE